MGLDPPQRTGTARTPHGKALTQATNLKFTTHVFGIIDSMIVLSPQMTPSLLNLDIEFIEWPIHPCIEHKDAPSEGDQTSTVRLPEVALANGLQVSALREHHTYLSHVSASRPRLMFPNNILPG